ncbi:acyl carrier protein [Paenibacillus tarimensis]|uniref:acyl carrier protein n=1 Tax=Paenibacillus tarimensis TaxID=416012 RepID=UPI001F372D30|nr:acyl carrier protein [Paenibacillus tarimensis]MCF2945151.1 acyl carrier protein [Paenibacillus tarimensis]
MVLNRAAITNTITEMIKQGVIHQTAFGEDEDLRELGFHSIAIITLMVNIESRYEIEYDDDELLLSNFSTVTGIVDGIIRKLEQRGRM